VSRDRPSLVQLRTHSLQGEVQIVYAVKSPSYRFKRSGRASRKENADAQRAELLLYPLRHTSMNRQVRAGMNTGEEPAIIDAGQHNQNIQIIDLEVGRRARNHRIHVARKAVLPLLSRLMSSRWDNPADGRLNVQGDTERR